ncbi:hypothetical protein [Mitsuokella multacida]|uniref:hypothetical protein n=1 Tax=Mitsuokella multacida TaxID=52226 RepID=UPI002665469D|nr:hypothetical protein [Mitsuokella multacida]
MGFEVQKKFDRNEVALDVMAKLDRHAATIQGIQSKAIFDIGEELQAAHDELANHRTGIFYAWCESIGIKPDTVKNILNYHRFIGENFTNKKMLEELPKSLIYQVSKKSAPAELKQGVLNGDITTLKEYKELKAQLEEEKELRKIAENNANSFGKRAEMAETDKQNLKQKIRAQEADIETRNYAIEEHKKRAAEAEAKAQSLQLELTHKQSEVDALKHQQKMAAEPQVIYQDSPETAAQIDALKKQLADAQERANQQAERAEWAEKMQKSKMDQLLKKDAELQALKNNMSLQVYSQEHEELAQYQSTHEEDYQTAQKALKWLSNINQAPQTKPEMDEWIRCLLMDIDDKQYEMISYRDNVETAMKKLQMMYEALTPGGLKVVK